MTDISYSVKDSIDHILKEAYYIYALKTITDRAIPHLYDGLKPVQRRILYSMHLTGPSPTQQHKKCARIVGDTLGKLHPHSDGSVYGALVNMTQDYCMYPFIDGQGNFGTRGEDAPAAMRYTECRLMRNAVEFLLKDLEEECVEFIPNYDQTEREPIYLPARVPVILLNMAQGIAVSLGSHTMSHNIREVAELTKCALDEDKEKAYEIFKGPDWRGGGKIVFTEEEKQKAFYEGTGSVKLYGKVEFKEDRNKAYALVWSLPPTVSRRKVLEQLVNLKKNFNLHFETFSKPDKPKIKICFSGPIEQLQEVLFAKTNLSTSYTYNLTVLDDAEPVKIGIWPLLLKWVEYRKKVLLKKFELVLAKVRKDLEFYELVEKVAPRADELFEVLRGKGYTTAKEYLSTFTTSQGAVKRLLSVKVSFFSKENLEDVKLKLQKLKQKEAELVELLSSPEKLKEFIKNELDEISFKYPEREVEVANEEASRRVIMKLPKKLAVNDTRLVIGQGTLYPPTHGCLIIGTDGIYRIRVGELSRYKDNVSVEASVIAKNTVGKILKIDLNSEYMLLVNKNGSILSVNLNKLRATGPRIRKYEEAGFAFDNSTRMHFIKNAEKTAIVAVGRDRVKAYDAAKVLKTNRIFKTTFPIKVRDLMLLENNPELNLIVKRKRSFPTKMQLSDLIKGLKFSAQIELLEEDC